MKQYEYSIVFFIFLIHTGKNFEIGGKFMSVQSLDRAFDILEVISRARHSGMTLTDIGKNLNLSKSTVHRLLASLKDRGYIEKDIANNMYRLGLGFIELSSVYLNNIEIKTEAEPYLQELSGLLQQTVFMAVMRDNKVVYIDKFEQHSSLRRYSIIGQSRPLYCTSLGKSLILDRTDKEIEEIVKDQTFEKLTEKTITTLEGLQKEIKISRERGWTADNEENEKRVSCIGAPIYDYRGSIIAAISVAWNMDFQDRSFEELSPLVKETTAKISKRLGYLN